MASRNLHPSDAGGQTRAESSTPLHQVGQLLKRARESQGLSLQQLAETLHMGEEQLQALESGDRDHLAETVFVKATVRRVANKLKVDPEPLIAALHDLDGAKQGRLLRSPAKPAQDESSTSSAEPTSNHCRGMLRLASGAASASTTPSIRNRSQTPPASAQYLRRSAGSRQTEMLANKVSPSGRSIIDQLRWYRISATPAPPAPNP